MKKNHDLIKGTLKAILLELLSNQRKMYGYQMMKELEKMTDSNLVINESALYQALYKLEAQGVLTSTLEQVDNRPRKYYFLTESGRKERKNKRKSWNNLSGSCILFLILNWLYNEIDRRTNSGIIRIYTSKKGSLL
jgi:PadR family transcriptional regulator PadR